MERAVRTFSARRARRQAAGVDLPAESLESGEETDDDSHDGENDSAISQDLAALHLVDKAASKSFRHEDTDAGSGALPSTESLQAQKGTGHAHGDRWATGHGANGLTIKWTATIHGVPYGTHPRDVLALLRLEEAPVSMHRSSSFVPGMSEDPLDSWQVHYKPSDARPAQRE
jgi:hypothetical protein